MLPVLTRPRGSINVAFSVRSTLKDRMASPKRLLLAWENFDPGISGTVAASTASPLTDVVELILFKVVTFWAAGFAKRFAQLVGAAFTGGAGAIARSSVALTSSAMALLSL